MAEIGGYYSKDDVRDYYINLQIRVADLASIEVLSTGRSGPQLAKDSRMTIQW